MNLSLNNSLQIEQIVLYVFYMSHSRWPVELGTAHRMAALLYSSADWHVGITESTVSSIVLAKLLLSSLELPHFINEVQCVWIRSLLTPKSNSKMEFYWALQNDSYSCFWDVLFYRQQAQLQCSKTNRNKQMPLPAGLALSSWISVLWVAFSFMNVNTCCSYLYTLRPSGYLYKSLIWTMMVFTS